VTLRAMTNMAARVHSQFCLIVRIELTNF